MNKKILFSACFLLIATIFSKSVNAKVWRVNNNAGVNADFTQLSTAISNASVQNGDTIYLEGSTTTYSAATLNKRLVIIGPGYFLNENAGLQASINESTIASISLDSLGSGSVFLGIRTGQIYTNSNPDNITISRCNLSVSTNNSVPNSKLSNWVISKSQIGGINFGNAAYVFENLQVINCFINSAVSIASNINNLFRNNIFFNHVTLSNCYISNNIFLNFPTLTLTNCTVKYNMAQANALPAGNNNQNSITQASLFTLTGSSDARFQLRAGSPAIGAGEPVNGVTPDIGAFGTADPYRLSGIPPIPTIYALTVPASVPSSATTMTITISTRSNN